MAKVLTYSGYNNFFRIWKFDILHHHIIITLNLWISHTQTVTFCTLTVLLLVKISLSNWSESSGSELPEFGALSRRNKAKTSGQLPCRHFYKGFCARGPTCSFSHTLQAGWITWLGAFFQGPIPGTGNMKMIIWGRQGGWSGVRGIIYICIYIYILHILGNNGIIRNIS